MLESVMELLKYHPQSDGEALAVLVAISLLV